MLAGSSSYLALVRHRFLLTVHREARPCSRMHSSSVLLAENFLHSDKPCVARLSQRNAGQGTPSCTAMGGRPCGSEAGPRMRWGRCTGCAGPHALWRSGAPCCSWRAPSSRAQGVLCQLQLQMSSAMRACRQENCRKRTSHAIYQGCPGHVRAGGGGGFPFKHFARSHGVLVQVC